jgi:hypothetical protein
LTLHTIRRQRTEKPFFVLKIDMMKANRVEWYYFYGCLVNLGFALPWIKSIVRCMTNVRYVVRVNGDLIQPDSYPRYLSGRSNKPLLVLVVQGGFVALARRRHAVLRRLELAAALLLLPAGPSAAGRPLCCMCCGSATLLPPRHTTARAGLVHTLTPEGIHGSI